MQSWGCLELQIGYNGQPHTGGILHALLRPCLRGMAQRLLLHCDCAARCSAPRIWLRSDATSAEPSATTSRLNCLWAASGAWQSGRRRMMAKEVDCSPRLLELALGEGAPFCHRTGTIEL